MAVFGDAKEAFVLGDAKEALSEKNKGPLSLFGLVITHVLMFSCLGFE